MAQDKAPTLESRIRQLTLIDKVSELWQQLPVDSSLVPSGYARAGSLLGVHRGLEKENLRALADGQISQEAHPAALGSALTHPSIITDFSEGLLEMVTAPKNTPAELFQELLSLEQYVLKHMGDELLWAGSMPPTILDPLAIQIANYGRSPIGQMKHIYRQGLALRYGKMMQVISGIHFNFSFSKSFMQQLSSLEGVDASELYMGQVRQMLRDLWILPYLFGASPAASRSSILGSMPDGLVNHAKRSVIGMDATSLRLGGLGYHNKGEDLIAVDYSSVTSYAKTLFKMTHTPYLEYESLEQEHTAYRQLNTNILQIENEYYMPVRPKQVAASGEIPSRALASRGVEYVELRAMDLDPFEAQGISPQTVAFLDVFMFTSMLTPGAAFKAGELKQAERNIAHIAAYGRRGDVSLQCQQGSMDFKDASDELFERLIQVARWMDQQHDQGNVFEEVVTLQKLKLSNPALTPSAKIIEALTSPNIDYDDWMLQQSEQHRSMLLERPIDQDVFSELDKKAEQSIKEFERLESHAGC